MKNSRATRECKKANKPEWVFVDEGYEEDLYVNNDVKVVIAYLDMQLGLTDNAQAN